MPESALTTVMGPGPSGVPNKLFEPPRLLPTSDKLIWRKKVRMWAKTIKTLAKGGDSKAISAYKAMGFTLYQSIDDTYAGKLEGAIVAGILKIEPDEDEEADPIKTVEGIIKLVAKDSIMDTCRREATMLKEIHACKRKEGETATAFAHRYEGMALRYINNCDALGARQISKSFAVTLLDNANITPSVYSSIISQVVASAKERGQEEEKLVVITKESTDRVDTDVNLLIQEYQKHKIENDILLSNDDDPVMKLMIQTKKGVEKINRPKTNQDPEDRPNACITLEDAVQALSDVRVEDSKEAPQAQMDRRAFGTMLGKRSYDNINGVDRHSHERGGYDRKARFNTQPFDPTRQKSRMCKQKGHFYKDPACIFNQIRELLNRQGHHPVKGSDADEQARKHMEHTKMHKEDVDHPKKRVRFSDDNSTKKSSFFQ